MSDPLDVLRHGHDAIEPDPEFRARLMARLRDTLAARGNIPPEAVIEGGETWPQRTPAPPAGPERRPADGSRRDRRRWRMAAAAVAAAVLVTVIVTAPGDEATDVEVGDAPAAERPEAPLVTEAELRRARSRFYGVYAEDGRLMVDLGGDVAVIDASGGSEGTSSDSPFRSWSGTQVITGFGGSEPDFVATCCDDGVGTIWRDGVVHSQGTTLDMYPAEASGGWLTATLDPATSTVQVDELTIVVPDAVDVTWLADDDGEPNVAVVVGGASPHVLVLEAAGGFDSNAEPDERVLPLPAAACGGVGLANRILLQYGEPRGGHSCVTDRAQILDLGTGATGPAFDLPAAVHTMTSNHLSNVAAVTTAGDVLWGRFNRNRDPRWRTVYEGPGYLGVWIPS